MQPHRVPGFWRCTGGTGLVLVRTLELGGGRTIRGRSAGLWTSGLRHPPRPGRAVRRGTPNLRHRPSAQFDRLPVCNPNAGGRFQELPGTSEPEITASRRGVQRFPGRRPRVVVQPCRRHRWRLPEIRDIYSVPAAAGTRLRVGTLGPRVRTNREIGVSGVRRVGLAALARRPRLVCLYF